MPHLTPESLIPRTDSKNPASTCRGLTSNGKPCRRSLSKSPNSSPSPSPQRTSSSDGLCWQHKDQAAQPGPSNQRRPDPLRKVSSIESLEAKFPMLKLDPKNKGKGRQIDESRGRPSKPDRYREEQIAAQRKRQEEERRQQMQAQAQAQRQPQAHSHTHSRHRQEQQMDEKLHDAQDSEEDHESYKPWKELLCCIGDADEARAPRPTTQQNGRGRSSSHVPPSSRMSERPNTSARPSSRPPPSSKPSTSRPPEMLQRPHMERDPSSRTGEFLALIPSSASPETTSALLAELAKPISESDNPGFIYMFWLTSENLPTSPTSETASSLLAPPSRPMAGRRRTSDVLNSFTSAPPNKPNQKTMLLKIGRAENVHRRLQQWQRQCGYNLSLIRYYPYNPSAPQSNVEEPGQAPRKVPNVHKVERLIHIELNARRVNSGKCKACGKEHREWFEVDANRDGVRGVDEVVRRWVEWAERSDRR